MSNLSILRHHLKSNCFRINYLQGEIKSSTEDISMFYGLGNPDGAFHEHAYRAEQRKELAKLVVMQKRIKAEIAAIFRIERIRRKYVLVFGKLPSQNVATTYEQEAMLDKLLAEKVAMPVGEAVVVH